MGTVVNEAIKVFRMKWVLLKCWDFCCVIFGWGLVLMNALWWKMLIADKCNKSSDYVWGKVWQRIFMSTFLVVGKFFKAGWLKPLWGIQFIVRFTRASARFNPFQKKTWKKRGKTIIIKEPSFLTAPTSIAWRIYTSSPVKRLKPFRMRKHGHAIWNSRRKLSEKQK